MIATVVTPWRAHSIESVRATFSAAARNPSAAGSSTAGGGATSSTRPGLAGSIQAATATARIVTQAPSSARRSAS